MFGTNLTMFKNYINLVIMLLLASNARLFSQEISHEVLVPVAGIVSTGEMEFTQTIGETAIQIIGTSDIILTQGFQQPRITFSPEIAPLGNGVNVYPNPVTDIVNVELFGDGSRSFRIDIITISGTLVRSEKMFFSDPFWQIRQYSVDQLSKGLYFIRVISDDGVINRTFKITKM